MVARPWVECKRTPSSPISQQQLQGDEIPRTHMSALELGLLCTRFLRPFFFILDGGPGGTMASRAHGCTAGHDTKDTPTANVRNLMHTYASNMADAWGSHTHTQDVLHLRSTCSVSVLFIFKPMDEYCRAFCNGRQQLDRYGCQPSRSLG
jgi:hypothetical protein